MKNLITLTNELRMIMFNRIGLELYGINKNPLPTGKALRDIKTARKENRALDKYIDKYIKIHEEI